MCFEITLMVLVVVLSLYSPKFVTNNPLNK